ALSAGISQVDEAVGLAVFFGIFAFEPQRPESIGGQLANAAIWGLEHSGDEFIRLLPRSRQAPRPYDGPLGLGIRGIDKPMERSFVISGFDALLEFLQAVPKSALPALGIVILGLGKFVVILD